MTAFAAVGFANPPSAVPPIDIASAVRDFVAGQGAGFRECWHWNPTLPGSAGDGMSYPKWSRADVLGACYEAAKAGAEYVPYIGGGATGDIDTSQAAIDALATCIGVACDQVADDADGSASAQQGAALALRGRRYYPEANNKTQPWIQNLVAAYPNLVSPCAEWWLWDAPVTGAGLAWNPNRWRIQELLDAGTFPTVIITRDKNNKGYGFAGTNYTLQQWAAKKADLAKFYRGLGCKVVVRATGLSAAQLAELRGMQ